MPPTLKIIALDYFFSGIHEENQLIPVVIVCGKKCGLNAVMLTE